MPKFRFPVNVNYQSVECKQLRFEFGVSVDPRSFGQDDVGFELGTLESSYRHTCGREMLCFVRIPSITVILVDALFVKASIHH